MKWTKDATSYDYGNTGISIDINEHSTHAGDRWNVWYYSKHPTHLITFGSSRKDAMEKAEIWYKTRVLTKGE
jgi:hypothetical protein